MAPLLLIYFWHAGLRYRFQLCRWDLLWNDLPGLYAFIGDPPANTVLYIGETGNFATRMPGHEVWEHAVRYGARHVYALHFDGADQSRKGLERSLIETYDPPCNTQHRLPTPANSPSLAGLGISSFGMTPPPPSNTFTDPLPVPGALNHPLGIAGFGESTFGGISPPPPNTVSSAFPSLGAPRSPLGLAGLGDDPFSEVRPAQWNALTDPLTGILGLSDDLFGPRKK